MAEISSNKTIAKNTVMLYIKMVFTLLLSLYTSRVILNTLGVVDNGVYNVVGGAVGMFMFLNGALSGATSRFLTYEQVRGDADTLNKTFCASLLVHIVVGLVIILLLETVGLWLLNNKLVIPEERMHAARIVYQFSVIATLLSITQVPYSASVISHEKMGVFAFMSILEALLKLLICYLILISPFDKLVTYGFLIMLMKILVMMIYRIYCRTHFKECHFRIVKDWQLIKPILTFSGWDLFGNLSCVVRDQGVDIVQNIFGGPVINSAAGLAGTANGAVASLANNITTAIRPSIVKCYSIGDIKRMEGFMIDSAKYTFAMLLLLAVPFFFESQFIMTLWLKEPPEHTAAFAALGIGQDVLAALFSPFVYAIHASGKIRRMSLISGTLWILVLPISYFFLKMGYGPEVPYIVKFLIIASVAFSNIHIVKRIIPEFEQGYYLKKTLLPALLVTVVSIALTSLVYIQFKDSSWVRFLSVLVASTISVCLTSLFILFSKKQRITLLNLVKNKVCKKVKP